MTQNSQRTGHWRSFGITKHWALYNRIWGPRFQHDVSTKRLMNKICLALTDFRFFTPFDWLKKVAPNLIFSLFFYASLFRKNWRVEYSRTSFIRSRPKSKYPCWNLLFFPFKSSLSHKNKITVRPTYQINYPLKPDTVIVTNETRDEPHNNQLPLRRLHSLNNSAKR